VIGLLPPLPVAGPLAVAGVLLALSRVLPSRVPDVVAILTALLAAGVCLVMAMHTAEQPLVYWFGGWEPRDGQVLGIGFVVDQAGATIAAFIGLLFAATLVFAWGYYDEVHAHFHVLMLLFMAGMVGFWRGSNQGNTQNEKSLYHQSSIDFRCYLEMALFEPRPASASPTTCSTCSSGSR